MIRRTCSIFRRRVTIASKVLPQILCSRRENDWSTIGLLHSNLYSNLPRRWIKLDIEEKATAIIIIERGQARSCIITC
jgi:hypothetical protein